MGTPGPALLAALAALAAACDPPFSADAAGGERERAHEPAPAPSASPAALPAPRAAAPADAAADAPADTECGASPLPDCPLQAWMKAHANPPVLAEDFPALAAAFDRIAALAPAGYPTWVSIAKDGAAAATMGDAPAAKAACRGCHDQYKQRYKTELRAREI